MVSPMACRLPITVVAALTILPAVDHHDSLAQTIPPKGTPQTFEAATWNIEFFGSPSLGPSDDARQLANVRAVIEAADIDLWALQEIANTTTFNTLLTELGAAYGGLIAPTSAAQGLGLAFVYKKSVIQPRAIREVLTTFNFEFAGRPPYQLEANVVLPDTTVVVTFINLHMKASSDLDSYNRRVDASSRLKTHIDFSLLSNRPVLIIGDLNDLLDGSIRSGNDSPYDNFVLDTQNYDTPTLALQLDGRNTFCGSSATCTSGSAIDHIIITDEVAPWYVTASADHYIELTQQISSYVFTTSDHLPVFARFDVANNVAVEDHPGVDPGSHLDAYPNPFDEWMVIEVKGGIAAPVRLEIYDVAGRLVERRVLPPVTGVGDRLQVHTGGLASGVYLITASADGKAIGSRVVVRQ